MQDLFSILILGLVTGAIYAVAASGLVLTYTTTGVFNFAHGAVGMVAVYAYWELREHRGLPTVIALLLVLFVLAPTMGALTELIMRRFHGADAGTLLVVTIGITVFLIGLVQRAFGPETRNLNPLISAEGWRVAGIVVSWDQWATIAVAIGVAAALRFLLFSTRLGTAMRAVVDNPTLAGLNGARPVLVARYSWMLGYVLAALSGVLIGPAIGIDAVVLTFLVINAYAAAMVGKLTSLPLTFAGAIGLALIESAANFAIPKWDLSGIFVRMRPTLPTIFLFIALLALPTARLSVGRVVGASTPGVPNLRESLRAAAIFLGVFAVVARLLPAQNVGEVTGGVIFALIMLSLVALTGFSGLVSLSQMVFVGLGAWTMGSVAGGDSLLGIALAPLVAVPIGVLIALPSLRLQGLYLALSTFAFARLAKDLVFQDPHIFGTGNQEVGRLDLFGLSFAGDRMFLFLCVLMFAAVAVGVLALRRSAFGRTLTAMRDSQAACATLGLDIRRQKLLVFMIAAAIAGLAGALYGGLGGTVGEIDFTDIGNLPLFLLAVVGGITTVTGAAIGGALYALLPILQSRSQTLGALVFAGIGASAIALGRQPNGIAGILFARWEAFRRNPAKPAADTAFVAPSPAPAVEVSHMGETVGTPR